MQFRPVLTLACATGLLAACSSADDAEQDTASEAAPAPVLTSTPVPAAAADGTPLAAGVWAISEDGSGASAAFGLPQSDALLVIACETATRQLTMSLESDLPGAQSFVIEAGGAAARLDMMSDTNDALPYQAADIARDAPVFGGFVQPNGVISITYPGGNVLRVPTAPGIRRVFEACA